MFAQHVGTTVTTTPIMVAFCKRVRVRIDGRTKTDCHAVEGVTFNLAEPRRRSRVCKTHHTQPRLHVTERKMYPSFLRRIYENWMRLV